MDIAILALLVPFAFIGSIAAINIFNASCRHRERIEMIHRGMDPDKYIPMPQMPQIKTSDRKLFWGIFFFAIGLAFVISSIFIQRNIDRDMMTVALLFLFGGGAMLLYWKLTAKDREHARRLQEEYVSNITEKHISVSENGKTETE